MNESDKAAGFDSDRLIRRLERERRMREIELSFQNMAEESKQKQTDIYNNVFTEEGQKETMENQVSLEDLNKMKMNLQRENVIPEDFKEEQGQESGGNNILSRVTEIVTPKRLKQQEQNPVFHVSPTGVASFPEIGPIGIAGKTIPEKKKANTPSSWHNDGPGVVGRMGSARVQNTLIRSFFSVRKNNRRIIFGFLLLCFLIALTVTLSDLSMKPLDVDWDKLGEIRIILTDQNVDKRKFYDHNGAHFLALVWLTNEASETTMINQAELLERFVLVLFYYSTISGSQGWKHAWLQEGVPHCQWYNVGCEQINGIDVVRSIDLTKNNLSGTITEEISKLVNLRSLILSDNNLRGTVPSSIGQLRSLETFEVGQNQLTGEMPSSVCNLHYEEKLTRLASDCGGSDGDIVCMCCTYCSP